MSIQIKLKNSVVQDSTPSTSDLPAVGEIALNANINSIGGFMRASDNSIVKIFGPGSLSTPTATTTVSGISELATNSETTTGTATNRVVTPAGLNAVTTAERTTSNTNYVAKAGSTLTGVLTMPNGSNSAPAINFGDSDSGIFGGTNTVSLAAGGTTRLTAGTGVSVTGTLTVSDVSTFNSNIKITDKIIHSGDENTLIRFPAADTVSIETNGSEAIRVDSSRRLLVGTSTARSPQGISAKFQIEGTGVNESSMSLTRNSADNGSATLIFNKSRGAAVGSDVVVQNNDILGFIYFAGNDGTDSNNSAASISAFVDGTPGSNDMPGRLVFSTTADGAASPTERLTIDSAGLVKLPDNGKFVAGAAADLQIFHDGNNSIILEQGTGNLAIQSSGAEIQLSKSGSFEHMVRAIVDGAVELYHNNVKKIETTSSGVSVTGDITGTGDLTIDTNTLHVDSSNNRVGIGTTSPVKAFHNALDTTLITGTAPQIRLNANANDGSDNDRAIFGLATSNSHFFSSSGAGDAILRTTATGKLLFGTGTAEHMRLDSSGRLLLGTTVEGNESADDLTVHGSTNTGITVRSGTSNNGSIFFSDATSGTAEYAGFVQYAHADDALNLGTASTTKMTIDSSGRLLLGTTTLGEGSADNLTVADSGHCGITIRSGSSSGGNLFFTDATSDQFQGFVQYNHSSNHLGFGTNKIERLRISSNGDARIGGGTPATFGSGTTVFETYNANNFTANLVTSGTHQLQMIASQTHGVTTMGTRSNHNLNLSTNDSTRLTITTAGNVGIGTTNLGSHQLVVEGGKAETGGSCLALKTAGNASGTLSDLALYGTFVSPTNDQATRRTADITSGFSTGNWGTEFLAFNVGKSGSSNDTQQVCDEQMRLNSSGQLSIGGGPVSLNGHNSRLSVQGTNFAQSTFAITSNSGDNNGAYLFFAKQRSGSLGGNTVVANGDLVGQFRYLAGDGTDVESEVANISVNIDGAPGSNDTPGRITFATTNDGGNVSTERMRIHQNGSVSINTTTSYGRLHVKDNSFNPNTSTWLTNASYVASNSFGGGYCLLDGSKGYSMYCHGSGANFSIQHHTSTTATASGGVQLTNGATSWSGMSDERDKENLVTISDAITKIKTLRTVIGNYIWQPDVKHAFLIAQDVQAVLPEAVDIMNTYEETEKQRLGLRYTEVIPLLTAALQEAVAEIDTLKTKVAALEAA